jgi:RNA polymerase sigma-70 factor (ECF subfamily)
VIDPTGIALQAGPTTAAAVMENCRHLATRQNQRPNPSGRFVDKHSRRSGRTQLHDQTLEAFEQMLLTSRAKFVAMAYSILRNKEDAEDAVQNAFLSAYLHLRAFEGRSEEIMPWEQIPSSEPDPEKVYASEEALEKVDAQLATMRPALRQAFVMTYYGELSREEACDLLGIPIGTFKARLFRARRQVISRVSSTKYLMPSCSHQRNSLRFSRKEVGIRSPLTVPS